MISGQIFDFVGSNPQTKHRDYINIILHFTIMNRVNLLGNKWNN